MLRAQLQLIMRGSSEFWRPADCDEKSCQEGKEMERDGKRVCIRILHAARAYHGESSQKTAGKFKLWLDDHSGKPDAPSGRGTPGSAISGNQCGFYVLLSDWRQLKPCMDILAEAHHGELRTSSAPRTEDLHTSRSRASRGHKFQGFNTYRAFAGSVQDRV
ncbi:unnamed protein product [Cladocopium goreaui]|uniref:Uncharacterized protein n=1 Tax=Cladocopium goreaui TaxID=2562237 RepID=A0A9P1C552_9DINO|nr:unnamed protein product [Cladocopium goreaui]